jgi:hypothetical protein
MENKMYKVFGEVPTAYFDTKQEAENYIKDWEEGSEFDLNIIMSY